MTYGVPTRWARRSRILTSFVTHGSQSSSHGRYRRTRSSQPSLPSWISIAIDADPNGLLQDPIAKRVFSSTGSGLPNARTPYPLARTTESFLTIEIARPGTSHSRIAARMYPSRSVSGARCAVAVIGIDPITATNRIARRKADLTAESRAG